MCKKDVKEINEIFFSIKDDGIKCESCAKQDKGAIKISDTSYTSLLYILSSDPKKLFSYDIPENTIIELGLLAKLYTNQKLEKDYKVDLY